VTPEKFGQKILSTGIQSGASLYMGGTDLGAQAP